MSKGHNGQVRKFQSARAIFAGMGAVFVLSLGTDQAFHASGIFPPWGQTMSDGLFGIASVYRVFYGIVGGYLTARLSPRNPMTHALILGGIGLVFSLGGAFATWNANPPLGPHWYAVAVALMALPCSWLGAKILLAQKRA